MRNVCAVLVLAMMAFGLGSACAPAAPAPPAAAPAPAAAQAAPGAPRAAWEDEWDQALAAARQEGTVVVAGPPGPRYRDAALAFEKAFPGIALEFTGGFGRDLIPRILGERRNGVYNWDVFVGGSSNGYDLLPAGALQPLSPALILPAVTDDSKWFGGFADGYHDKAHQYVFGFIGQLSVHVFVNRDVVPAAELSHVEQLVEPGWKGQIVWQDPRVTGAGATTAGQLLLIEGEDFYRKLLAQDVVAMTDARQQAELLVRGRYPIGIGVGSDRIAELQEAGLGKNVEPLDPHSPAGSRISSGFGALMLMDHPPHPNAAKVFVNWLLSQEGQTLWAKAADGNSRRLDVPGPPDTALYPGVERRTVNDEEYFDYESRAREIAREIIP
jgi:iron(III) transport system substrate-binding protein